MKNKKNMIFEIIKKELRDIIRDKKTLLTMIVLPMVLFPLLIVIMFNMEDGIKTENSIIGFDFEIDQAFNTLIEEMNIEKITGTKEELNEKFENKEIDAYITLENKKFTIYSSEKSMNGQKALTKGIELIESYKQQIASQMLTNEGLIPDEIFNLYTVETENLANADAMTSFIIGYVPSLIFMIISFTAVFSAIDMTAGEKERGTLETFLTFPLKNSQIIWAKFFATSICAFVSAFMSFISLYRNYIMV